MSELFRRRYQLLVGAEGEFLDVSLRDDFFNEGNALRISFIVEHDYGGYASYADITVYNLREDNANKIFEKYREVILQAGYPELYGPIFKGQVINVQRVMLDDGTRGVRMFCRSAAKELDTSFINTSFSPMVPIVDIIRACASVYGLPIQFVGDFSQLPLRAGGTVLHGDPKSYLQNFKKVYGFRFMVENGVMLIIKDGAVKEGDIFEFSARTGMKGSPRVTDIGVDVATALNPIVQLGNLIKINSLAPEFAFSGAYFYEIPRSIGEGVYEVARITYIGDSHGQQWDSQFNCYRYSKAERDAAQQRARENGL